jgi:hypothetical protein
MRKLMTTAMFSTVIVFAAACSSKKEGGEAQPASAEKTTTGAASAPSAPAGPAAGGALKLGKLGLQMDAPGRPETSDLDDGSTSIYTQGMSMLVGPAQLPKDVAAAKKADEIAMKGPKNMKDEALPDGWVLTFNNPDTNTHYVYVRREIGGTAYRCDGTAETAEQSSAIVAICKSLRK